MGQAKHRGTFEQRKAAAEIRIAAERQERQARIDALKKERAELQAELVRLRPAEAARQKAARIRGRSIMAIAAGLAISASLPPTN